MSGVARERARFALGLVVGKFSPLHLGHEWLIRRAEARCERLLLLSYSRPEHPRCGPDARRRWFSQRFPQHEHHAIDDAWVAQRCGRAGVPARAMPGNDAPDGAHQQYLAWLLKHVLGAMPDAMFASEPYVHACARVLTQTLGHPVQPVLVDPDRRHVPVSGTAIREGRGGMGLCLAAEVARNYVPRIALLGGESSGKTTLAAALAQRIEGSAWVAEYGRERWEAQQGRLDEADLLAIAREQVAREERIACSAPRHVFCDTTPLTTFGYAHWMFGRAAPELRALAQRRYDLIVLCAPDFEFVQDGSRRGSAFRDAQHAWYLAQLRERAWPWVEACGSLAQRVEGVARHLGLPPTATPAGASNGGASAPP